MPVATRLLLLWKTTKEAISAFIEKNNAEEHLDHLEVLQSAEQQALRNAAQGAGVSEVISEVIAKISEVIANIFEFSHRNREILEAQLGYRSG